MDLTAFFQVIDAVRDRLIFLFMLRCGLRVSEVCALTWDAIDRGAGTVRINRGKGQVDRIVYLAPDVEQALEIWRAHSRSCIQLLRIIHSTPKPATMSPLHHHPRGHCHGTNPLFLPTRSRGAGVRLPPALLAMAQRRRFPSAADRANHTIPTQTLHGAQTVCWPDPATAVRPV